MKTNASSGDYTAKAFLSKDKRHYAEKSFRGKRIFLQLKCHLNSVKIDASGKFMQFQYINHSCLEITFSFIAILFTTLI